MSRRLRTRIVMAFGGFAIAVAAILGLSTVFFLYAVEDRLFGEQLRDEAARLEVTRATDGRWDVPRHAYLTVHESLATLPADLREQVRAEPRRREFPGAEGRHYHLRPLGAGTLRDSIPPAWLVAEVSEQLVVRPMRGSLLWQWFAVNVVTLLVAIALALWLARRIARPLSSLAGAVRGFDPGGPARPIVIDGADDEVAVVARALDDARTRVEEFVSREQAFTQDASHELRTPLSVIRSTTAQVLGDPQLTPEARRLLVLALQSSELMERTITSLLALARETAWERADPPTLILPVLEEVVLAQSAALEGREVSLSIDVARDATLRVPEDVLRIVLSNLIANAFAHAAPGVVRVWAGEGQLGVSNPVVPGTMPDVGELDTPGVRRAQSPGLGLGLAIVRRLSERAGLTLRWEVSAEREFRVVITERGRQAGWGPRNGT